MKKLFLLTFLFTALLIAWDSKDCDHIYVAVEQPELQVNQTGTFSYGLFNQTLTGKHEGKGLVCIRCFKKTKQILDYGERGKYLPLTSDTIDLWDPGKKTFLIGKMEFMTGSIPRDTTSK